MSNDYCVSFFSFGAARWASSEALVFFVFCLGRPCGPALLLCFFVLVWGGPLGQLYCLCLFCFIVGTWTEMEKEHPSDLLAIAPLMSML